MLLGSHLVIADDDILGTYRFNNLLSSYPVHAIKLVTS